MIASHDILGHMAADVAQLTRPIRLARGRQAARLPSLLDQLRVATIRGHTPKGPERRRTPTSQSPANDDALRRLQQIEAGVAAWARRLSVWPTSAHHPCPGCHRPPPARWPELALGRFVDRCPQLAPAIAHQLAADVRQWLTWAAKQTGWTIEDLKRLR